MIPARALTTPGSLRALLILVTINIGRQQVAVRREHRTRPPPRPGLRHDTLVRHHRPAENTRGVPGPLVSVQRGRQHIQQRARRIIHRDVAAGTSAEDRAILPPLAVPLLLAQRRTPTSKWNRPISSTQLNPPSADTTSATKMTTITAISNRNHHAARSHAMTA